MYITLPIGEEVNGDNFSDGYILRKMLSGKNNILQMNINLELFISKISIEGNLSINYVLLAIRKSRLNLFQDKMFQMLLTTILAEVNVIKKR